MSSGRAFHKVGALWENALHPYVLRLHLGTIKSFFSEDLRFLVGMCGLKSSLRYRGPKPFNTLKTRRSILKSIRADTGSQCKLLSTGVTCSYLLVAVSRRAAEFCTCCSLLMLDPWVTFASNVVSGGKLYIIYSAQWSYQNLEHMPKIFYKFSNVIKGRHYLYFFSIFSSVHLFNQRTSDTSDISSTSSLRLLKHLFASKFSWSQT